MCGCELMNEVFKEQGDLPEDPESLQDPQEPRESDAAGELESQGPTPDAADAAEQPKRWRPRIRLWQLFVVVTIAAVVASRFPSPPPLARVTGVVTLDGEPLPGGTVVFFSKHELGVNAVGRVGPDGSYDLWAHEAGRGASVGENEITIQPPPSNVSFPGGGRQFDILIPRKYARRETSGITEVVRAGVNTINIDLVSR